MNKKGQVSGNSLGLVLGLVGGVAALVITVIIAFTVVGTMDARGGNSIIPQTTYTVTNESDLTGDIVFVNTTTKSVNGTTYSFPSGFVITAIWVDYNQSNGSADSIAALPGGYNKTLAAANYTFSSAGVLDETGTYVFPNASISYTFKADNSQNLAAGNMTANFSSGVQNVSSKVPTVLLIAAVVLIIGILAVLVGVWQRMRLGGGGGL